MVFHPYHPYVILQFQNSNTTDDFTNILLCTTNILLLIYYIHCVYLSWIQFSNSAAGRLCVQGGGVGLRGEERLGLLRGGPQGEGAQGQVVRAELLVEQEDKEVDKVKNVS